jgi:hypothetical protein
MSEILAPVEASDAVPVPARTGRHSATEPDAVEPGALPQVGAEDREISSTAMRLEPDEPAARDETSARPPAHSQWLLAFTIDPLVVAVAPTPSAALSGPRCRSLTASLRSGAPPGNTRRRGHQLR